MNETNEKITPLERALRQQAEKTIQSFLIIGAPISNNFFPISSQELLYKYPHDLKLSDKVIAFLKSPTRFERISLKKYMEIERMEAAVTILPGSGLSQYAVIVSHLEPVCMHSSLIPGPIILPSTISSFNAVRRFYVFICLQPHILGLVSALKIMIKFDFGKKLSLLTGKSDDSHDLKRIELEEMIRSLIEADAPRLEFLEVQVPRNEFEYLGYVMVLTHSLRDKNKQIIKKSCQHSFNVKYTSLYPIPNLMLISDFAIPLLFEILPITIILDIFEAILIETSVIVTSSKPSYFTAVCFGFLCLLHPLSWQGVFLPIVPESHLELLDAPVPGIFGTQPLRYNPSSSGYLVNIDAFVQTIEKEKKKEKEKIAEPKLPTQSILPHRMRQNLKASLEEILSHWKGQYKNRESEFTTEILNIMWISFYNKLFYFIVQFECDSLDELHLKLKEIDEDEATKTFLMKFIQTQHFNAWWFSQYLPFKEAWIDSVCWRKAK